MAHPSKHEILIVDDEAVVRDTLAMLLQASGYDVSVAGNGFEAGQRLGAEFAPRERLSVQVPHLL